MHICIWLQGKGEGQACDDSGEEGSHPSPVAAGGLTFGTHQQETHTHLPPMSVGCKVLLSWKVLVGQIINHKLVCLKTIFRHFVTCFVFCFLSQLSVFASPTP